MNLADGKSWSEFFTATLKLEKKIYHKVQYYNFLIDKHQGPEPPQPGFEVDRLGPCLQRVLKPCEPSQKKSNWSIFSLCQPRRV